MLTPRQFREKARRNISDAKLLLNNSPQNAAYIAGYAVEYMLKARYCILRKWKEFPDNHRQLDEWNKRDGIIMKDKLMSHDLDTLLRLSDSVFIKSSSFRNIDWERACDWSEQLRYVPNNSLDFEKANSLISEVENIYEELLIYEVLNCLLQIEIDLTDNYGMFHCFALVKHPKSYKWILLISYFAQNQVFLDDRKFELEKAVDNMDDDLRTTIDDVKYLAPQDRLLQGLYMMLQMFGGGILHSPRSIFSNNIVVGYPVFPPGFVITAGNWSHDCLINSWPKI